MHLTAGFEATSATQQEYSRICLMLRSKKPHANSIEPIRKRGECFYLGMAAVQRWLRISPATWEKVRQLQATARSVSAHCRLLTTRHSLLPGPMTLPTNM